MTGKVLTETKEQVEKKLRFYTRSLDSVCYKDIFCSTIKDLSHLNPSKTLKALTKNDHLEMFIFNMCIICDITFVYTSVFYF